MEPRRARGGSSLFVRRTNPPRVSFSLAESARRTDRSSSASLRARQALREDGAP